MRDHKISCRQYLSITALCLLSPVVRVLPKLCILEAGGYGWLGALWAAGPAVGYAWVLSHVLSGRRDGEGFFQYVERMAGKPVSIGLRIVFLCWFLFYAAFTLRSAATRLADTIYNSSEEKLLAVVLAAAACFVAAGSLRSIGRTAEVMAPIIGGVLAVVLLVASGSIQLDNYETAGAGVLQVMAGGMAVTEILMGAAYFMFLAPGIEKAEKETKKSALNMILIWLAATGIVLVPLGVFGEGFLTEMKNPFYMLIKNISISKNIQRIEAIIVPVWCLTDVLFLAVLFRNIKILAGEHQKEGKSIKLYLLLSAVIFALSRIIGTTDKSLALISEKAVPVINLCIVGILLPYVYIVVAFKTRKKEKNK